MDQSYLDDPEVQRLRERDPAALAEILAIWKAPDPVMREVAVADLDKLERKQARGLNVAARLPVLRRQQETPRKAERNSSPCADREAYWRLWCRLDDWRPGVLERKQGARGAFVIEYQGMDGALTVGPRRMVLAHLLAAPAGHLSTTGYVANRLGISDGRAKDLRAEIRQLVHEQAAPLVPDEFEVLPIPAGTFERVVRGWRVRGHYEPASPGATAFMFVVDDYLDTCACGCGEPVPAGLKHAGKTKTEQSAHRMRAWRKAKTPSLLRETPA